MAFSVDGNTIPEPQSLEINEFDLENSRRLGGGKLVKELIATKKIFTLTYPVITWANLKLFRDAYQTNDAFTFIYEDQGATQSATVFISKLPRRLSLINASARTTDQYRDVTIEMEEQ